MQRGDHDVGRQHDDCQDQPNAPREKVDRDQCADGRHDDRHASVEQQTVRVDAHASGNQSRHAKQSRKIEDVRPHYDADAGVLVSRNNRGGPNAGHTIVVDGETFKIRQIPSGVLRGKTCVIGAGCVVDPEVFLAEVDELESRGVSTGVVHLSGEAHLIMPWHVAIDQASERLLGKLQIGTTRRGIGPCYADKAARLGIRVQDLLEPKILRQKIEVALAEKNVWLGRVYGVPPPELEETSAQLESFPQRIRPYGSDTSW